MKLKKRTDLSIIQILLSLFVVHIALLFNDFHTDDWQILMLFSDGFGWRDLISMENLSNFRPFTNIIIFLRDLFFGNNPSLWYLLNIALHLVIVYLLYGFVKDKFNKTAAVTSALFFGLYFQHFEAVLWIYGIVRLLAAFNLIVALIYLIKHLDSLNRKHLYISYIFFAFALYTVEDILIFALILTVAPIILNNKTSWRKVLMIGSGYWLLTAVYLITRFTAIGWSNPSTEYYFIGVHALKNLYLFIVWVIIPDLSHPYFMPYVIAYLPFIVPFISAINAISFAIVIAISIYLLIKGNRLEKYFILFFFVSLILPSFYDYKITTKLIYIPSLALAILFGSLFNRVFQKSGGLQRWILISIFAVYLVINALVINVTIYNYRITQREVRKIVSSIEQLNINWGNYEYLILDNIPGRARPGHYLKYRLGCNVRLMLNNEQTEDLPQIDSEIIKLQHNHIRYIYIDYNQGRPIIRNQVTEY